MVLDHARDFYVGFGDPTDMATTTPALVLTRWVTHYCAPGFVFLAGVSVFLQGGGRSTPELRRFLLTRGLWLVFLELTVVHFGWTPEPFYRFTMLQVIWVIGWSMVLLVPITLLPARAVLAIGLAGVALHNLLDPITADAMEGPGRVLWAVLHDPTHFEPAEGHHVMVGYALLPWLSVMCVGYGLGEIWTRPTAERRRLLLGLGGLTTLAFVLVRAVNQYGDPEPWAEQPSPIMTVLSFLNCTKYPPSLDYILMTLGPILCLLALFESEKTPEPVARVLEVFGRVPLFFYVAHIWLLRPVGIASAIATLGLDGMIENEGAPGWPLWAGYVAWLTALLVLYPACRWFGAYKRQHQAERWWLRYL
jgi:uncharacterized membrane protein